MFGGTVRVLSFYKTLKVRDLDSQSFHEAFMSPVLCPQLAAYNLKVDDIFPALGSTDCCCGSHFPYQLAPGHMTSGFPIPFCDLVTSPPFSVSVSVSVKQGWSFLVRISQGDGDGVMLRLPGGGGRGEKQQLGGLPLPLRRKLPGSPRCSMWP